MSVTTCNTIKRLFWKHSAMRLRAKRMNLFSFPERLDTFKTQNPTDKTINNDFKILSNFEKHPIFINFVPNYNENQKDQIKVWIDRICFFPHDDTKS